MNKTFRLIWNAAAGCWNVASELVRSKGKTKARTIGTIAAGLLTSGAALAELPTGGQIIAGSGSINQNGNTLTVTQDTQRMAANWNSFSIGQNNTVEFIQPSSSSVALNRVTGIEASILQGNMNANGHVILVNPNGIHITNTAQINVGGIIASTLDITTEDFMAGNYSFSGMSPGQIINQGNIQTPDGGTVAFIAAKITNTGTIHTPRGNTLMGAGSQVTLDLGGPLKLRVDQAAVDALIESGGAIRADGGYILIEARAAGDLKSTVINHTGILEAKTLGTDDQGRIALKGDSAIEVSGTLTTQAPQGTGGTITVEAEHIHLTDTASIDATGATGGGNVLIGGDWQGGANAERRVFDDPDALKQATTVVMEQGAVIDASATDNGDGGTVVLWSDISNPNSVTAAHGTLYAKGGKAGGDGGQIETSGARLVIDGVIGSTAARSKAGQTGQWLFDPYNIEISSSADSNMTSTGGPDGFDASGIPSILNVQTLVNALQNSNVTVSTGSGGSQTGNITVSATIDGGASIHLLKLEAAGSVIFNQSVVSDGDMRLHVEAGGFIIQGGNGALGTQSKPLKAVWLQAGTSATDASLGNIYTDRLEVNSAGIDMEQQANTVIRANDFILKGQGGATFTFDQRNQIGRIAGDINGDLVLHNSRDLTITHAKGAISGVNYNELLSRGADITIRSDADVSGVLVNTRSNPTEASQGSGNFTVVYTGSGRSLVLGNPAAHNGAWDMAIGGGLQHIKAEGGTVSFKTTASDSDIIIDGVTSTHTQSMGNVELVAGRDVRFLGAASTFATPQGESTVTIRAARDVILNRALRDDGAPESTLNINIGAGRHVQMIQSLNVDGFVRVDAAGIWATAHGATITADNGITRVAGGGLTSLGGSLTTNGADIAIHGDLLIRQDLTFTTGGGDVVLGGRVDSIKTTAQTLTGSGSFNQDVGFVEVLLVGGGGAGGWGNGSGGGGGGGVVYAVNHDVSGPVTYSVGAGGQALTSGSAADDTSNGGDTQFGTLAAIGGGRGASTTSQLGTVSNFVATAGGSGGGGVTEPGVDGTPGASTDGQGNRGGTGTNINAGGGGGGGGGGAGGLGANATSTAAGGGGDGLAFDISGSSITYATGGGGSQRGGSTAGQGGSGGIHSNSSNATGLATAGTGAGGAAKISSAPGSQAGASGTIVVRYQVDGSSALTINAGTGDFVAERAIGGQSELKSLTVDAQNIEVNGEITWSSGQNVSLNAGRDIAINGLVDASQGDGGKLVLNYGQSTANGISGGVAASYQINAPVRLQAGQNFTTKLGSSGSPINYTVITSLGTQGSNTANDLQGMRGNLAKNYALGANIDASATKNWNDGAGFAPIGQSLNDSFTGTFNGLGNQITGLHINRPNSKLAGLIGVLHESGVVRNLGVVDAGIFGSNEHATPAGTQGIGILVGDNYGLITDSYAKGAVNGRFVVGGLVGQNRASGFITHSYVISRLPTLVRSSGGFVGINHGTIADSYAVADIEQARWEVGGFVGKNSSTGSIKDSYAASVVTPWLGLNDQLIGGFFASNEGTLTNTFGRGGQDRYFQSTYGTQTDGAWTGFDFDNTWFMIDGQTRPMLRMERSTQITNANQLQLIAAAPHLDYTLANDINFADEVDRNLGLWRDGFVPVGDQAGYGAFSGALDGNGQTITGIDITADRSVTDGLFGDVSNARIFDLTLSDTRIVASNSNGGGNRNISSGVTMTGNVTLDAGAANVTVLGTIGESADKAATVNIEGTQVKLSDVLSTGAQTIIGSQGVELNGNLSSSGQTISVQGPVTLNANVTIDTTAAGTTAAGALIDFTGTVNSDVGHARNLNLIAGAAEIDLPGAVGAQQALGAVTIESAGDITFGDTVRSASFVQTTKSTGLLTLGGELTALAGNITINTNTIDINAPIVSQSNGNISMTANDIRFPGVIQTKGGNITLTALNGGITAIDDGNGGLASIITQAAANSGIASGNIVLDADNSNGNGTVSVGILEASGANNHSGAGSHGGDITIRSDGAISYSRVLVKGGNGSGGPGGNSGDIKIVTDSPTGLTLSSPLVARGGTGTTAGLGGTVTLEARGDQGVTQAQSGAEVDAKRLVLRSGTGRFQNPSAPITGGEVSLTDSANAVDELAVQLFGDGNGGPSQDLTFVNSTDLTLVSGGSSRGFYTEGSVDIDIGNNSLLVDTSVTLETPGGLKIRAGDLTTLHQMDVRGGADLSQVSGDIDIQERISSGGGDVVLGNGQGIITVQAGIEVNGGYDFKAYGTYFQLGIVNGDIGTDYYDALRTNGGDIDLRGITGEVYIDENVDTGGGDFLSAGTQLSLGFYGSPLEFETLRTHGGKVDISGHESFIITFHHQIVTGGGDFLATGLANFSTAITHGLPVIDTSGASGGGSITIQASGDVSIQSARSSGGVGASGGDIDLRSNSKLVVSALNAEGGNAALGSSTGAAGGTVTLEAPTISLSNFRSVSLNLDLPAINTGGGTGASQGTGGDIHIYGSAVITPGSTENLPTSITTGSSGGHITFHETLNRGSAPTDVILNAGTGAITFSGAVGQGNRLNGIKILGAGSVTANAAFLAADLGIRASGNVTFNSAGNDVDRFAVDLQNAADLVLRDVDGLQIATIGSGEQAISGLTGTTAGDQASEISLFVGGALTQASSAVINTPGSLAINTTAFAADDVTIRNISTDGTLLGNSLVAGTLTVDSTQGTVKQAEDQYLRVGDGLVVTGSEFDLDLRADHYLPGGVTASGLTYFYADDAITVSQSGDTATATATFQRLEQTFDLTSSDTFAVVSGDGSRSISSVTNGQAVNLNQDNVIGGAITITTAGTYSVGAPTATESDITVEPLDGASNLMLGSVRDILIDSGLNLSGKLVGNATRHVRLRAASDTQIDIDSDIRLTAGRTLEVEAGVQLISNGSSIEMVAQAIKIGPDSDLIADGDHIVDGGNIRLESTGLIDESGPGIEIVPSAAGSGNLDLSGTTTITTTGMGTITLIGVGGQVSSSGNRGVVVGSSSDGDRNSILIQSASGAIDITGTGGVFDADAAEDETNRRAMGLRLSSLTLQTTAGGDISATGTGAISTTSTVGDRDGITIANDVLINTFISSSAPSNPYGAITLIGDAYGRGEGVDMDDTTDVEIVAATGGLFITGRVLGEGANASAITTDGTILNARGGEIVIMGTAGQAGGDGIDFDNTTLGSAETTAMTLNGVSRNVANSDDGIRIRNSRVTADGLIIFESHMPQAGGSGVQVSDTEIVAGEFSASVVSLSNAFWLYRNSSLVTTNGAITISAESKNADAVRLYDSTLASHSNITVRGLKKDGEQDLFARSFGDDGLDAENMKILANGDIVIRAATNDDHGIEFNGAASVIGSGSFDSVSYTAASITMEGQGGSDTGIEFHGSGTHLLSATGAITLVGSSSSGQDLELRDVTARTETGAIAITGNIDADGVLTFESDSGSITLLGANNQFAQHVDFASSAAVTLGNVVDGDGSNVFAFDQGVSFSGNPNVTLAGTVRTPSQSMDFGTGAVTLATNIILDSTNDGVSSAGASITIGGTIDASASGAQGLRLIGGEAGSVNLQGNAGVSTPLGVFEISSAAQADLAQVVAASIEVIADNIDLNANTYNATIGTINLTGAINLSGGTVTVSTSNNDITIKGSIDDAESGVTALTLDAGSAQINVDGGLGQSVGLGNIELVGGRVQTNAIGLGDDRTLTVEVSDINQTSAITGAVSGNGVTLVKEGFAPLQINAALTGDTALTINAGQLTLFAGNTNTGNISVNNNSRLQVGAGGETARLGLGPVAIDTNALVRVFLRSTEVELGNAFSGQGTLSLWGTGSAGQSTYSITNAGSFAGEVVVNRALLTVSDPAAMGTSSISVRNAATLSLDLGGVAMNNDLTLSGLGWLAADQTHKPALEFVGALDNQYSGAIILTDAATIGTQATTTLSGTIDARLMNGASALTLINVAQGDGGFVLSGGVGQTNPITSLTAQAPVNLAGNITTTGAQTFEQAVTLTANTALTSQANGLTFSGTLDGAHDLTLTAGPGDITFTGLAGHGQRLGTVAIREVKDVTISAGLKAGAFEQRLTDESDFAGSGEFTLNGALSVNAGWTTISSEAVDLNASIVSQSGDGNGQLFIDAGLGGVTLAAGQSITTTEAQGVDSGLIFIEAEGSILLAGDLVSAGSIGAHGADVQVHAFSPEAKVAVHGINTRGGQANSDSAGFDAGWIDLAVDASGVIELNDARLVAVGSQGDAGPGQDGRVDIFADAIVLSGDVVIDAGKAAGVIHVQGEVNGKDAGQGSLSLSSDLIEFSDAIGMNVRVGHIDIISAVDAYFYGAVTAAGFEQQSGSGDTGLYGGLDTNTSAGVQITTADIIIEEGIVTTNGGGVMIDASSSIDIDGITADGPVSLKAGDLISIGGDITTAGENVTFEGNTELFSSIAISTGGGEGTVRFKSMVNNEGATGPNDLTITAGSGDILFDQTVGLDKEFYGPLGAVTLVSARHVAVAVGAEFNATTIRQLSGSGTTTFGGAVNTTGQIDPEAETPNRNGIEINAPGVDLRFDGGLTLRDGASLNISVGLAGTGAGNGTVVFGNDVTLLGEGGDITINANAIKGGNAAGTGSLSFVMGGGGMTVTGPPTITAKNMAVTGASKINLAGVIHKVSDSILLETDALTLGLFDPNTDAVELTIRTASAARNIQIGGGTDLPDALTLTDDELFDIFAVGQLRVGHVVEDGGAWVLDTEATGTVTVDVGAFDPFEENTTIYATDLVLNTVNARKGLALITNQALALSNVDVKGGLTVQADGAITQAANTTIEVNGLAEFSTTSGDITLGAATGQSFSAGSVRFDQAPGNVTIDSIGLMRLSGQNRVAGDLALSDATGITALSDSWLEVTGHTTLDADEITLSHANNRFEGDLSLQGSQAAINSSQALTLDTVNLSGNLTLTVAGLLDRSSDGSLNVGELAHLTTTTAAGHIVLRETGSNQWRAGSLRLNASGDVDLLFGGSSAVALSGASTVAGTLDLVASGGLTGAGTLEVTGAARLGASATTDITLTGEHSFSGGLEILTSRNVSLKTAGVLELRGADVRGNLALEVGGALTQSAASTGAISVAGSTTLESTNAITLINANNALTGAITITTASDFTFVNNRRIVLGDITLTGELDVSAMAGDITQSDALAVAGFARFDADEALTLNNAGNNFGGPVGLENRGNHNVSIRQGGTSALVIDVARLGSGTLTVTAGGDITQNGAITAAGLALQGPGHFTLTNTNNSVTTLAGGNSTTKLASLSFVNSAGLAIGSVNPKGITASGDVFIATVMGDLRINEAISTDSDSISAIVLAAGTRAGAGGDGTPADGNILINGSPDLTAGSGGTIALYSGDVNGSTGLTDLVGSGSGNFRYNTSINASGEVTAGYSKTLATNVINALYRQQPSISGSISSPTITYGDPTPSFTLTGGLAPVNDDQPFAIAGAADSGAGKLKAGSYTVDASAASDLGYSVTGVNNGTLTVSAKALDISGLSASNKIYDALLAASLSGSAALTDGATHRDDGLYITGDRVELTGTAVGAFDTANVGDNKIVTVTGLRLTGEDADNYVLNYYELAADITPRPIILTANAATKVYGNDDPAFTYGVEARGASRGLVGNDTFSGSAVRVAGEDVGDYTIEQGSVENTNYTITWVEQDLSITPRAITLSADSATKIYGDLDPTLSVSIVAGSLGSQTVSDTIDEVTGTLSRAAGADVGRYDVLLGTGSRAGNYTITFEANNQAFSITPREVTLTADAATKVYGEADPTLTFTPEAFTAGRGLVAGDTFTGSAARVAGEDVGDYTIEQGSVENTNYTIAWIERDLTITPRPITLIANSATKIYGDLDPTLSVSITAGSLGSQTVSDSIDDITGVLSRESGANVGPYDILLGTGSRASNYTITFEANNQAFFITPRPITLTADAATKIYGEADPTLTFTPEAFSAGRGLVAGDQFVGSIARASGENVGGYAINQGTLANNNYDITWVGRNLTITPRAITLAADAATKVYGDLDPTLSVSIAGGSLADNLGDTLVDVTGEVTRESGQNAGLYNILLGTGAASGNYAIAFEANNNAFEITPARLVATGTKVYDGSVLFAGRDLTIVGVNGEQFTAAGTGVMDTKHVKSDQALVSVAGLSLSAQGDALLSNYELLDVSDTTVSVTPRPVTLSATGVTKIYDATLLYDMSDEDLAALSTQLVGGDNVVAAELVFDSANVSRDANGNILANRVVTLNNVQIDDGNLGANYIVSTTDATDGRIDPAALSITAVDDAKFVTQADPNGYSGVIYNGFVGGDDATVAGLFSQTGSVSRTNTDQAAQTYEGVLMPSGWQANNYEITFEAGDFTIVPADTLLVRVPGSLVKTYGDALPQAQDITAQYLDDSDKQIKNLVVSFDGVAGLYSIDDGAGAKVVFGLDAHNANRSGAGLIRAGGYNIAPTEAQVSGANFQSLVLVGALTVAPKTLNNDLGITEVSKVYDGNRSITGLDLNFDEIIAGVIGGDAVSLVGQGVFADRHVGSNKLVTLGLALRGEDASSYRLSTNNVSDNLGTITQRESVTWVGADGDNWSDARNWQDGALPDRDNVATVVIPESMQVTYDSDQVGVTSSAIANAGTIRFTSADAFSFTNAVSGSGSIEQRGTGMLSVGGNNSAFTGSLDIANYAVTLASANALGQGSLVSDGGRLALANGMTLQSLTVDGDITTTTAIRTLGNQTYNDGLTFLFSGTPASNGTAAVANFSTTNGNIVFNTVSAGAGSKDAERSLVVAANNGTVTFSDQVGYSLLASQDPWSMMSWSDYQALNLNHTNPSALEVSAEQINVLADITTFVAQTFNGPVVVGNNGTNGTTRLLLSMNPTITFNDTIDDVDGTHTLIARAISVADQDDPVVEMLGEVGGAQPLQNLIIEAGRQNGAGSVGDIDTSDRARRSNDFIGEVSFASDVTVIQDISVTSRLASFGSESSPEVTLTFGGTLSILTGLPSLDGIPVSDQDVHNNQQAGFAGLNVVFGSGNAQIGSETLGIPAFESSGASSLITLFQSESFGETVADGVAPGLPEFIEDTLGNLNLGATLTLTDAQLAQSSLVTPLLGDVVIGGAEGREVSGEECTENDDRQECVDDQSATDRES
ncbi:filamentous hemagglutinin family N-terminal domain-containing protein [Ectothiorhodosinus mongolicus]|uniref:Probable pectate lyase C n=2 Tax=Ectothiorhodosinus mongolicus TaxID=233100 RepID=A0A1R3VM86_9GAMM|nr:MBG domain-containing protein [Ectothiorhodosinus mongolicus]ULX57829.1 hypothetical protein CKX93_09320 [Ectothiorhodosinus mongolicus]SIT65700.1 filamentous hemagglutinin family N-terminal domain-containing protein [Ectothiorhodosinus mongolicus]